MKKKLKFGHTLKKYISELLSNSLKNSSMSMRILTEIYEYYFI